MFLYYLLTSNDIQKEIIIRAGNSTIPDLNHSDFYSIKTSVPALDEQTAIGAPLPHPRRPSGEIQG